MMIYRNILLMGLAVSVFGLASIAFGQHGQGDVLPNEILDLTQDSGSDDESISQSDWQGVGNPIWQLIQAVADDKIETVIHLLESNDVDLETVFYEALVKGNFGLVKYCLQKGVNVDSIYTKRLACSAVPLAEAMSHGTDAIIRELINAGAQLEDQFLCKEPTLYLAAWDQDLETVKYLVERGLKIKGMKWKNSSPLNAAAAKGDIPMLRFLLGKGISIKQPKSYKTAAQAAAEAGKVAALSYVLRLNPELAAQKYTGFTPLYKAASVGNLDCVRLLVENYHVSLDVCVRSTGHTPLTIAATRGHEDVVRYLIRAGAQLDKKTKRGETALDCAQRLGKQDVMKLLSDPERVRAGGPQDVRDVPEAPAHNDVEGQGQDEATPENDDRVQPDQLEADDGMCSGSASDERQRRDQDQKSLTQSIRKKLMQEIADGNTVGFVILLQKNRSLARKSDENGYTLLHHAARHGNRTLFFALLGAGAAVDQKDDAGYTTLHYAALSGNEAIVDYLLQRNLSTLTETKEGDTPFYVAVKKDNLEVVSLFLEKMNDKQKMAALNRPTTHGMLPLHEAAKRGFHRVGRVLIENGAFVSSYDLGCSTPIHYAVTGGHTEMVRLLLGYGACRQAQDKDCRIPLGIARAKGNREIVKLLRERDGNVAEPAAKRQRVCKEVETSARK